MILKYRNVERETEDPAKIQELKRKGWYVVYDPAADVPEEEDDEIDYSKLTKSELVGIAEALGIEGVKKLKKADLIVALEERR